MGQCRSKQQIAEEAECAAAIDTSIAALNAQNSALQSQLDEVSAVVKLLAKEQMFVLHGRVQEDWGGRSLHGSDWRSSSSNDREVKMVRATIRAIELDTTWEDSYQALQEQFLRDPVMLESARAGNTGRHQLESYGWTCGSGVQHGLDRHKMAKEERIRRAAPVFALLRHRLAVLEATDKTLVTLSSFVSK